MHGCGIKLNGKDSVQQEGQFIEDEYIGPSNVCDTAAVHEAATKATAAAQMASALQVFQVTCIRTVKFLC